MDRNLLVSLCVMLALTRSVYAAYSEVETDARFWVIGGVSPQDVYDYQYIPTDESGYAHNLVSYDDRPTVGPIMVPSTFATAWAVAEGTLEMPAGLMKASLDAGVWCEAQANAVVGNQSYVNVHLGDTITLSESTTIILVGHVQGAIQTGRSWPENIGQGRAYADVSIVFNRPLNDPNPEPEAPTHEWVGFKGYFSVDLENNTSYNSITGDTADSSVNNVDETFYIPIQLPAGPIDFYAGLMLSVDLMTDDVPVSMDTLLSFEHTVGFEILLPAGVVATSDSGHLTFGNVPEPAFCGAMLLGLGMLMRIRPRRGV